MAFETTITTFFHAANSHNLTALEGLFTDDIEFFFPKTRPLMGKKPVLRFFAILFKQYPRLTFQVHMTIIQSEKAAVHWTNEGTNRKGNPYGNEGVSLLRFENNKICFISDFFKDTENF
jgi:ketosteroid isomerase-like protein